MLADDRPLKDRAVQAHHESRCTCGCDQSIEPGDWIVPDEAGGWQLLACAEANDA